MKRIIVLVLVLLLIIPYQSTANEKSDEQKRVDAINQALTATVKIVPRTKEIMGVILDPQNGSGFYISPYQIVTNWHVVRDAASSLWVYRSDGTKCGGKTGYRDEGRDLALVTTECEGAPLSIASGAFVGQDAYAIGNASIDFAVTKGIVVNVNDMGFLVSDTHVNYGNSGGPLIDSNGAVIGVVKGMLKLDHSFAYAIRIEDLRLFLRWAGIVS